MGKHSLNGPRKEPRGFRKPKEIRRLDPTSTSSETPKDQERRRREARQRVDSGRRRKRIRGFAIGCLATSVILLVLGSALGYFYIKRFERNLRPKDVKIKTLSEAPKKNEPFYMVLLGSDVRPKQKNSRSDTIIIARVDPEKRKVSMISIPRDSRVEVPGHGVTKVNSAMAYGGPELMIETLQDYTGLPISYYMTVNFEGFKDMVEAVGGVWVDVPKPIHNDLKASNYNREASTIEKGYQKLDGAHALTFVRSRQFPDGDFQRIRDQQIFIKALFKQMLRWQSIFKVNSILKSVGDNVQTNLALNQMLSLAQNMKGMKDSDLETAVLPGAPRRIGSGSYVVLDEEKSLALIERMKAGESLESTSTSGTVVPVKPQQVTVTVNNGAGVGGVAQTVTDILTRDGFRVTETGNMNQFVYEETLIVYKDDETKASMLRDSLEFGQLVQSRHMYTFTTDVLVVIGKDFAKRETQSGQPD